MSARSATEIVERMKELAQNLGAAFGRLITETMVPIIKEYYSLWMRKVLSTPFESQWARGKSSTS